MFFIFSLPRSGSAWLSVFLTGPSSFCFHEPTAEKNYRQLIAGRKERVVGAVDTGANLFRNEVYAAFPTARYYVLVRNADAINASAKRLGYAYDAKTQALPDHPVIVYERLNDLEYLRELWQEIIGAGFDEIRTKQLMEMNIQRDVDKFMSARGLAA